MQEKYEVAREEHVLARIDAAVKHAVACARAEAAEERACLQRQLAAKCTELVSVREVLYAHKREECAREEVKTELEVNNHMTYMYLERHGVL